MTKPPLLMNVYVGVNALFTRATVSACRYLCQIVPYSRLMSVQVCKVIFP